MSTGQKKNFLKKLKLCYGTSKKFINSYIETVEKHPANTFSCVNLLISLASVLCIFLLPRSEIILKLIKMFFIGSTSVAFCCLVIGFLLSCLTQILRSIIAKGKVNHNYFLDLPNFGAYCCFNHFIAITNRFLYFLAVFLSVGFINYPSCILQISTIVILISMPAMWKILSYTKVYLEHSDEIIANMRDKIAKA